MIKEYILPPNLLKTQIESFQSELLDYLENSKPNVIKFNFENVDIIISHSISSIVKLTKTISILGIKVRFANIPSHLALPLSEFLEGIPNVTFGISGIGDPPKRLDEIDGLINIIDGSKIDDLLFDQEGKIDSAELSTMILDLNKSQKDYLSEIEQTKAAIDYIKILERDKLRSEFVDLMKTKDGDGET